MGHLYHGELLVITRGYKLGIPIPRYFSSKRLVMAPCARSPWVNIMPIRSDRHHAVWIGRKSKNKWRIFFQHSWKLSDSVTCRIYAYVYTIIYIFTVYIYSINRLLHMQMQKKCIFSLMSASCLTGWPRGYQTRSQRWTPSSQGGQFHGFWMGLVGTSVGR